jgi:hypothetical protein
VISEAGFAALRRAATLVHAVPTLRVRLRSVGAVMIDVAADGTPPAPDALRTVTPCAFRNAVARAWDQHRVGERVALFGLPVGVEPAVELGVPPCGQSFPGEIHCVPLTGRYLYVFATTFPIERCRERADHHLADISPPDGLWAMGLRHDEATDVNLAFAELAVERREASERATVDLLEALLADIAVRQLLDELSPASG